MKRSRQAATEPRDSWVPLRPLTTRQGEYIEAIETTPLVLATGFAGTSKTYIAARKAAEWFREGTISTIVLGRPAESQSKSLGFFKGTKEEKMLEWIRPIYGALRVDFSNQEIANLIKRDALVMQPLETIKGCSFSDSFVILDEAEDINPMEAIHIATRIGDNSRCVVCGDTRQSDLQGVNGLAYLINLLNKTPSLSEWVKHVDFGDPRHYKDGGDVVRSRLCSEIIKAHHKE